MEKASDCILVKAFGGNREPCLAKDHNNLNWQRGHNHPICRLQCMKDGRIPCSFSGFPLDYNDGVQPKRRGAGEYV
jgi:hypothetical protein